MDFHDYLNSSVIKNLANKFIKFIIFIIFLIWILSKVVWLLFPIFTREVQIDSMTFYARNENINNKKISKIMKTVLPIISKSAIYSRSCKIRFYITNSPFIYALLFPEGIYNYSWESYATAVGNNIVFKKADFSVRLQNIDGHTENLDSLIVHEMIHVCQYKTFGDSNTPEWVEEGYATYFAARLSAIKLSDILEKSYLNIISQRHISPYYLLWGLMVKHAIEQMHYSVDDLHLGKVDYDTVYNDMMKHCKTKPFLDL